MRTFEYVWDPIALQKAELALRNYLIMQYNAATSTPTMVACSEVLGPPTPLSSQWLLVKLRYEVKALLPEAVPSSSYPSPPTTLTQDNKALGMSHLAMLQKILCLEFPGPTHKNDPLPNIYY